MSQITCFKPDSIVMNTITQSLTFYPMESAMLSMALYMELNVKLTVISELNFLPISMALYIGQNV